MRAAERNAGAGRTSDWHSARGATKTEGIALAQHRFVWHRRVLCGHPEMRALQRLCVLGVAGCAALPFAWCRDLAPRQLHLAFADETTMHVGWLTFDALSAGSMPIVHYGVQPGRYTASATGTSSHDPSASFLHHHHDVTLRSLRPGTTYFYAVGAESSSELSSEHNFTTLAVPSHNGAFKCSMFGDMGVNESEATIARLQQHVEHAFILHVGDVSYADDLDGGRKYQGGRGYEQLYDRYGEMVEPLTSSKAYFVSPGNHDVSCHILSDAECIAAHRNFTPYNRRWHMPSDASGGTQNMWYSFRAQRTHFVSISTETDYAGAPTTPGTRIGGGRGGGFGDQLAWLEADLKRAQDDSEVDWIVVVGHRPVYQSLDEVEDWPVDTVKKCRAVFEPLFHRYGVDLYVGAHKHYYERLAPLYKEQVCSAGTHCTTFVVHGSAGNNEPLSKKGTLHKDWVRGSDYEHRGFLELEVVNRTRAFVRFFRAEDGLVHDEGVLQK